MTVTIFRQEPLPVYQFVVVAVAAAAETVAAVVGVVLAAEDAAVAENAAYSAGDGLGTLDLAVAAALCLVYHLTEKGAEMCHPNLK
jgi:hypothetical protein